MTRRGFLKFLGLVPAIPLAAKLPALPAIRRSIAQIIASDPAYRTHGLYSYRRIKMGLDSQPMRFAWDGSEYKSVPPAPGWDDQPSNPNWVSADR